MVKVVGDKRYPRPVGAGVEEVVSEAMENPEVPDCVCLGCRSIWSLEGFGFGSRCWVAAAGSWLAPADRSSLWSRLGGRWLLPQTMLLNYLQQMGKKNH